MTDPDMSDHAIESFRSWCNKRLESTFVDVKQVGIAIARSMPQLVFRCQVSHVKHRLSNDWLD
jgi:hypothetical protein